MVTKLASCCAILAMVAGFGLWVEDHYANASDLSAVKESIVALEKRINFQLIEDKLDSVEEKIHKFEVKQDASGLTTLEAERFDKLESQRDRLQKQYDKSIE